jgi:alpha-amylase/alpha-mannosidase (GH57 family)
MTHKRYICIHGHFYQPPRENPWLESIEVQDSAYPYHDWNERITAESYAPNATSRILDEHGDIEKIVNNYSLISFNFGPTLLAWMQDKAKETYAGILRADKESRKRFSGHGSAMAQVYNHIIMPLANSRDKRTQVIWGIRDFASRFGRHPEGMWLAETAVDTESLELLAEHGVKFTLLAPHQARRFRKIGDTAWIDVNGGRIDPARGYLCKLPSGRTITLFFYDGPISQAVAFEGLLTRGENLANRLTGAFSNERNWPQLVHIATDGETYGHHHRHGDMALAYALQYMESRPEATLTNYGEYLALYPPAHEVEIHESSAWSCAHGVGRWRENCGCATGMNSSWDQEWRAPLRQALDWLRDTIAPSYEAVAGEFLKDPWSARNDYIDLILDRNELSLQRYFERHAKRPLSEAEKSRCLKLLEMQRHALLMYTSCGWFFDDISGIETVQVIQYAARVIQLATQLFNHDFETPFLQLLEKARSNVPQFKNGKVIYEKSAKPATTDLFKVGAHFAMTSLYEEYENRSQVYCYEVERLSYQTMNVGKAKIALGQARITSLITRDATQITFGVMHFGDHNLLGGVREYISEDAYKAMVRDVVGSFSHADFPETIRNLDSHFGALTYTLKSLFHDEQRRILDIILHTTLNEAETAYRQIYEYHTPLMRFLTDLAVPMPKTLRTAAEFIVNADLRNQFEDGNFDRNEVTRLLEEAALWNIELDQPGLGYKLKNTLENAAIQFQQTPTLGNLERFQEIAGIVRALPFEVSLWEPQNIFYQMLQTVFPEMVRKDNPESKRWVEEFRRLGELLRVKPQV